MHVLSPEQIVQEISQSPCEKVMVAVADIDGILRGKYIHKDKFLSAVKKGFGFCNVVFGWDCGDVCYDNSRYTGWHTGYPDAKARIDLATYRLSPWDHQTPFFLGDFVDEKGNPLGVCPRQLLKRVIQKTKEAGYFPRFALEFEWFNFKETPQSWADKNYAQPNPLAPGMFGYSVLRAGLHPDFFAAIMDQLREFAVPLEGLHTETGPGVYEAAIVHADALESADRALLFKTGVKKIAYNHNLMASFMAKWDPKLPGCSGHVHQSLWDDKKNVFFEKGDAHSMSPLFKQYLAGQMHCLAEILPFFAPNVNSYKRLVEGHWAPTRITWGVDNRTVAFRVIGGDAQATRLETRVPGADINPYLAVAAALASGLYGIEHQLELKEAPSVGNAYQNKTAKRLPKNLLEAAEKLRDSTLARELFGKTFVEHFANSRIWEWQEYEKSVSRWEMQRYFEII